MEILFARHGNTFGPGDKVVWVGRGSDLALVERGVEQAHEVAAALAHAGLQPTSITSGTLKRTRGSAEIIAAELGVADRRIDDRLDEIDYGAWEAKSSEEIIAAGGGAELEAWQQHDAWPVHAGWGSSREDLLGALAGLLADLQQGKGGERPLVVSSNGILRFVPRLLGAAEEGAFQLKTGHLGLLVRDAAGAWSVRFWGVAPKALAQ
jgi:broad specificity phosphatase PhoE